MRTMAVTASVVLAAATISWGAPVVGFFGPADGVQDGRWTESFVGTEPSAVGNQIEAESWDGATLGGQWVLDGATVQSDTMVQEFDYTDGGTVRMFFTVYDTTGATLTLMDAPGIWTGVGDGDYTVDLTAFTQQTTVFYDENDNPININGQISMQGDFTGFAGYSLTYLSAQVFPTGQGSAAPADFPTIDTGFGQWGLVTNVQLQIVPEPLTLGVLAVGGLVVLTRRRR